MKKFFKVIFLTSLFCVSIQFAIFATEFESNSEAFDDSIFESEDVVINPQNLIDSESSSDDVDSLFEESSDTTQTVTTPTPEPPKPFPGLTTGFLFNGNLNTMIGGQLKFYDSSTKTMGDYQPAALFEQKLSFSSRPIPAFSAKGTVLVTFPEMKIDLYELFFNYAIFDVAYLTVGKFKTQWGNGRVLDTNILDDEPGSSFDPTELIYKPINVEDSKFTLLLNVPIKNFSFTAMMFYFVDNKKTVVVKNEETGKTESITVNRPVNISDLTFDNASLAGMVEANFRYFTVDIFARTWAKSFDKKKLTPAVGTNINFQVADFHLYSQAVFHACRAPSNGLLLTKFKGTASAWWATREKVDLGFIAEYQCILGDGLNGTNAFSPENVNKMTQNIIFEALWGNIAGSKFSLGLKWHHNVGGKSGLVIPGVTIKNVLPGSEFNFAFPIDYAVNKVVFSGAIQLKLNINF